MKLPRKSLKRLLYLSLVLVFLWLLSSYAVAYRLTCRMNPQFAEPIPAISWGRVQPIQLTTSDNHVIGGWYIDGSVDRPIVLLLHGNGGCRSWLMKEAEMLHQSGCSVMLISFRAHGDSTGEFNDIGYNARHDVVTAIQWLKQHYPERRRVIWGQSMGAAAAVFAAAELGEGVHGYILECPYQDLKTAVWVRLKRLPPVVNSIAYAGLLTVSPIILPDLEKISPFKAVSSVPPLVPILIIAGSNDPMATLDEARAIASATCGECQFVTFETESHVPILRADPNTCRTEVLKFIQGCAKKSH